MKGSLVAFWVFVYVTLWLLKRRPNSTISRAAFTWFGPRPLEGQTRAAYQARWAMYSFGWLCQIALVLSTLLFLAWRSAGVDARTWFLALVFPLSLGACMAFLATLGFLVKAAKARYIGPNPVWSPPPDEHAAA